MTEREIRREVERAFYGYNELKQKAAEYIADAATNNLGVDYSRVRVCGSGADTDGGIVTALDRNQRNYLWCRVVELTKERFIMDSEESTIINSYFRQRKYKRYRIRSICDEIYISEATFYNVLKKILNFATQLALQFGLIYLINSRNI